MSKKDTAPHGFFVWGRGHGGEGSGGPKGYLVYPRILPLLGKVWGLKVGIDV